MEKQIICRNLVLFFILFSLFVPGMVFAQEESPQIAYRLLDDYIRDKEIKAEKKTGPIITMIAGGTLITGGTALMIWGDPLFDDPSRKYILGGSIAGSGVLTLGVGTALYVKKPRDFRAEYTEIFENEDPVVQEALAVGTLREMAENGKRERIISGSIFLAFPVVSGGVQIGANLANDKPWYDGLFSVTLWQVWPIISGISSFFSKSEGERLYDKYAAAREAFYTDLK